jgi:hypothetical protein
LWLGISAERFSLGMDGHAVDQKLDASTVHRRIEGKFGRRGQWLFENQVSVCPLPKSRDKEAAQRRRVEIDILRLERSMVGTFIIKTYRWQVQSSTPVMYVNVSLEIGKTFHVVTETPDVDPPMAAT